MNKFQWFLFVLGCVFIIFYFILPIIRRLYNEITTTIKVNKRVKVLRNMGFDIKTPIRDPHLSQKELLLLNSDETPNDIDILKYYKMYCKKFELDNKDIWTTSNFKPMSFDDWEKKAKTPTVIQGKGRIRLMIAGGYSFIISRTCDAMIGMPPYQTYHRYNDYEKMVEQDDKKFMKILESENGNTDASKEIRK